MTMTGSNDASYIPAGAEVYGSDGEKIGTVVEAGTNYLLVEKGWLFVQDRYLPMSTVARVNADRVMLSVTKDQADQMATDTLPAEGNAWYGAQRTGYTTTDTATSTATTGAATGYTTDRTAGRDMTDRGTRDEEEIRVPVVEEQLQAGVRETEAGSARIVKDVHEEQQSIDVPVEREEVYVTERAVNRPATQEDLQAMDRDIEVPIHEQEPVVRKQAMVTEEVDVRKEAVRETERVSGTVRREDVHVEKDPRNDPNVHIEGESGRNR